MARLERQSSAGRGVITYSSGNHAQGIAYAAARLGVLRHGRHA
jgi:threonine dehydratase